MGCEFAIAHSVPIARFDLFICLWTKRWRFSLCTRFSSSDCFLDGAIPEGVHPRAHALANLKPQAITASAGDMVIWHQALPHCATPNYGTSPRMVQYLSYISEAHVEAKEWV